MSQFSVCGRVKGLFFILVDGGMVIEIQHGFSLGVVSCSLEVRDILTETGIPQDELLRFHQLPPHPEIQADHQQALAQHEWICSAFELKQSQKTVWIVTDPQQKSTALYLEKP